jgi:hypothetical protein
MHHPGCWVTNSGCGTRTEHKTTPIAQAYTAARPAGAEAPHPGEGVRVSTLRPREDAGPPPGPAQEKGEQARGAEPWPVIGGNPQPQFVHRSRPIETTGPPHPPRRYVPPTGETSGSTKPLPKIYGGHSVLRYWYVPAAAGLALLVAFGVIWAADQLGGGSDQAASTPPVSTSAAGGQVDSTPAPSPASAASASASAAPGSGTSKKLKAGDIAVVTGAGDCLNVRTAPGRTNLEGTVNPAIICLKDGEEVTVTSGPEAAGDLQWWKVKTRLGEGWAAEDYLSKKQ